MLGIVSGLWLNSQQLESWQGYKIYLFSKISTLALGAIQPHNQWVLGGFFSESDAAGAGS